MAANDHPFSLIMEAAGRGTILTHLKKTQGLIGFSLGDGQTIVQLLAFIDRYIGEMFIDLVYLDFQKAFDTVTHKRLSVQAPKQIRARELHPRNGQKNDFSKYVNFVYFYDK